jgi:hypothetical protein|tara:strand:+ start:563 stop:1441 length:879 start_codon:yes stop_codon:yes gene_type:complete
MKNIIYSIYIKNDDTDLRPIHQFTKSQLEKHYQKLIDVKKEYAKHCNAEYRLYENDTYWQKFKKKFNGYQFDIINLYKIHLWEELGKTYDNVLYFDFDVIPNTSESFFDKFDMNYICVHAVNSTKENIWTTSMLKNYKKKKDSYEKIMSYKDKYNMYVKAMAKKAMLAIDNNFDTDYFIANTAILGGNSNATKQLRFTEKLDDMLSVLNRAREEKLFGENISKLFFPNNEVFFQYLLDKYKLKWFNIPYEWHTYLMDAGGKIFNDDITKETVSKAKLIHLINKRFEELWKVI